MNSRSRLAERARASDSSDGGGRHVVLIAAFVELLGRDRPARQELLSLVQIELGQGQLGASPVELSLGAIRCYRIGPGIDDEKQVAFFNELAVGEMDGIQIPAHPGADFDGLDRLSEAAGNSSHSVTSSFDRLHEGDLGRRAPPGETFPAGGEAD